MEEIVYTGDNGKIITNSLLVAKKFNKEHKHVMRDIKLLNCSDSFRQSNFGLSFRIREIANGGSKKEPFYQITRDGFTILVMGYTGKLAMQFKEEYIAAFNRMEAQLRNSETENVASRLSQMDGELAKLRSELARSEREREQQMLGLRFALQTNERLSAIESRLMQDADRKEAAYADERPPRLLHKREEPVMVVRQMRNRLRRDVPHLSELKCRELSDWLARKGYLLTDNEHFYHPSDFCLKNGLMACKLSCRRSKSTTSKDVITFYRPYITEKGYRYLRTVIIDELNTRKGGTL